MFGVATRKSAETFGWLLWHSQGRCFCKGWDCGVGENRGVRINGKQHSLSEPDNQLNMWES